MTESPVEVRIKAEDVAQAAALAAICRGLDAARMGVAGLNTRELINEGAALIRDFRPRDRTEWAAVTVTAAQFWSVAATFQPRLAGNMVAARKALAAAHVTTSTQPRSPAQPLNKA